MRRYASASLNSASNSHHGAANASHRSIQRSRSATAFLGTRPIARFGELARSERERRKLRQPVYLAEIDLAQLYALPLRRGLAKEISRYQAVERDFSFTFPDEVHWEQVAATIHALAIPELERLTPEEVFRAPKDKAAKGSPGAAGHYALLLRCIFQSPERTLREEELTSWSAAIIDALTHLGGALRV